MEDKKNITEIAQKQRYLSLLKKMKAGRGLSKSETKEIVSLEKLYKKPSVVSVSSVAKKRKTLPISVKRLKYYGFTCENLIEAENLSPLRLSLADIIGKYSELKAAWERGRFLRDIKNQAESGSSLEETAALLKFKNVKEFINMLESDYEAKSIWNSIRKDRI